MSANIRATVHAPAHERKHLSYCTNLHMSANIQATVYESAHEWKHSSYCVRTCTWAQTARRTCPDPPGWASCSRWACVAARPGGSVGGRWAACWARPAAPSPSGRPSVDRQSGRRPGSCSSQPGCPCATQITKTKNQSHLNYTGALTLGTM